MGSPLGLLSPDHSVRPHQHVGWNRQADLLDLFQLIMNSNFFGCSTGRSAGWTLPGPKVEDWQQVGIAVMMDLRDEQKELNRHMREQSEILCSVRTNTAWSRKNARLIRLEEIEGDGPTTRAREK